MSSFEETLARMKGLYTYGQELNENKKTPNCTLEYHKQGADGVHYGIVKECSKYYIKSAPKGKETIAEAYDYLGGFCNKRNYEYTSYANALKHFKLKLGSINEACDSNVQTENTDNFMSSNVLMTESTDAMRREIARQRQIMYNVSMIMNESSDINPSSMPVMYKGKNEEAETGKSGDEGYTKTKANPEDKGKKTNGLNKKAAPFKDEPKKSEDQLSECSCSEKDDWGSRGMCKGRDPKKIGWEMDGQEVVSEEYDDWGSEGLPGTPGVGEADTDRNNTPFTKNVNEEEDSDLDDVEPSDDEDIDFGADNDTDDEDFDNEYSDDEDFDNEDDNFSDDQEGLEDDDIDVDDDIDDEEDTEFELDNDEDDLDSEEDFNNDELDTDDDLDSNEDFDDDEFDTEDDLDSNEDFNNDEFGSEEDFDDEDDLDSDEDFDSEENFDDEDDLDSEEDFDNEDDLEDGDEDIYPNDEYDDFDDEDGDIEECGFEECHGKGCNPNAMMESKRRKMNTIVENVVNKILAEDELHVFGKHPGYRKRPFTLPPTGQDKNQWGEDWNDESVYSEQPFGETIGDGKPFDELVQHITNDVLYQLKTGSAFKKKVK